MDNTLTRHKRVGLSGKIFIGLLLGVACGLFFGEYTENLEVIGDAFIGLLQMTVIPYIAISIVANIGRLDVGRGGRLAKVAIAVLVGLWIVGVVVLMVMPYAFPGRTTASFFSASMLQRPAEPDYLSLFVPSNIFRSLVENAVPGIVLFCILIGVALIGVPAKDRVLEQLDAFSRALARVNGFIVRLTPLGVFAIAAATSGTMSLEDIGRLRAYLIAYSVAVLLLAFVLVPGVIASLTPFSYREILRATKTALITAFATGKLLVVLPMLIEGTKDLFRKRGLEHKEADPTIEVTYPLAYPFPTLGKVIALLFVPFAAWFVGNDLSILTQLKLNVSGLLSMFGGPVVTIPFLLDAARLPSDLFNLFMVSGVYTARLGDLLGVMHLAAIVIVTTCVVTGSFRVRWRAATLSVVASAVLTVGAIAGIHAHLAGFEDPYAKGKILESMHLIEDPVPAVVLEEPSPNPVPLEPGQSRLERIRGRGIIRVGFSPNNLPFSYFNDGGNLVGFDVDLAHRLARGLEVEVEFVPFETATMADQLKADHFDLIMAGIIGTIDRFERMNLSDTYLDAHLGLIVRDHDRERWATEASIRAADSPPRFGLAMEEAVVRSAAKVLPNAQIVGIESPREFFTGEHDLDGLFMSAEAGSAWAVLHPGFHVVRPLDRALPLVYPLGSPDEPFESYINHWIELARKNNTMDELYSYWIEGKTDRERVPRWSVIRDVLHWID